MQRLYPKAKYELTADDLVRIDASENLAYRRKILLECQDPVRAKQIYDYCGSGIEGALYWMNVFGWIYEPRDPRAPDKPFVTFDFQDDMIVQLYDAVVGKYDVLEEKSRDMGATWAIQFLMSWGWQFGKWEVRVGSRKQDYVYKRGDMSALMQKAEYILKHQPKFFLPKGFEWDKHFTYNILKNPESGNSMAGEPTGPEFGVGGRATVTFLDEFSKWEMADLVWKNTADISDCRIALGTPPESKTHKFARIRFDKSLAFDPLTKEGVKLITLHWRAHPLKDQAWYDRQKKRRSPAEIAKELDLSYEPVTIGRVYPQFSTEVDIRPIKYNPEWPLFIFWDYGEGGPDDTAMIWVQMDPETHHLYVIDAYKKNYQDIKFFAPFVHGRIKSGDYMYSDFEIQMIERHRAWRSAVSIGDPYNGENAMASGDTIKKLLQEEGVYVNHKRGTSVKDRINKASTTFKILHVNESVDTMCSDFVESLTEARWPSVTDNRTTPVQSPVHDHTSHFRTAYEYGIDAYEEHLETVDSSPRANDPYYQEFGTYYRLGQPN